MKTSLLAIEVGTVASVSTKRSLQALAEAIIAQCVSLKTMTRPSLKEINDLKVEIKSRFQILKVDNAFRGFWGTGATVASIESTLTHLEITLHEIYSKAGTLIEINDGRRPLDPRLVGYVEHPDSIGSYFPSGASSESFASTEGDAADTAHLLELLT